MKRFPKNYLFNLVAFSLTLLAYNSSFAASSCGSDCIAVKQTLVNGKRNVSDAFGRYVNLTTTLETNGYDIKRIFIQRNNLRADYRSCRPSKDDLVCSFPAFNLFYGRKPDADNGDLLTFNIKALGEHRETGETK